MNRRFFKVLIVIALIAIVPAIAFGEYDKDKVVTVMRTNVSLMGEINAASEADDWHGAAAAFWKIAEMALEIMPYTPPRGSKADWESTMGDFVNAAYEGIGAAGAQDKDALMAAFGKLRALNRQGHGDHK